jgi:TM2 domain-containing membrane protein YozV
VYIILGLAFGCLGFHNFYAGYYGKGASQFVLAIIGLTIGIATGTEIIGLAITGLWALVDICTVTEDAEGDSLA